MITETKVRSQRPQLWVGRAEPVPEPALCPCCGAALPEVTEPRGLLARLTGQKRMLLQLLLATYPATVSTKTFSDALWGGDAHGGPLGTVRVLNVQFHNLNVLLRPLGWQIVSEMGRASASRALQKMSRQ